MLLWALSKVEALETRKDDLALDWLENGIPWKPVNKSPSARASVSRTLSRLERGGLIERIAPPGRTVAFKLTILGRIIALRAKGLK